MTSDTTTVRVDATTTWEVPYGFGGAFREALFNQRSATLEDTYRTLSDLLALVGYEASSEAIATWDLRKRIEAEVHAVREHLAASDNPVRRFPRPSWMPEPWNGSESGEGVFAGPGGTVLA